MTGSEGITDAETKVGLLDANFAGPTVLRAIFRKLHRRLFAQRSWSRPRVVYNGLVVFDRPDLDGGGAAEGQNLLRVLLALRLGPCGRLFEFCAGPGYVGYSLLAHGFCEQLVLADINPFAAEAARKTARYNSIEHRVTVYQSDCLDQIPNHEKWDLVVGYPPCALVQEGHVPYEVIGHDPAWSVHRRFYKSVKKFIKPGGTVVLMECRWESSFSCFEEMIMAGGAEMAMTYESTDFRGGKLGQYFVVSKW